MVNIRTKVSDMVAGKAANVSSLTHIPRADVYTVLLESVMQRLSVDALCAIVENDPDTRTVIDFSPVSRPISERA